MADDFRTRAAAQVDENFRQIEADLFREHRRQEQRTLAFHLTQLQSFARNREIAEVRYLQRMKRIEGGYERAAASIHKRQNSVAGRLERLTKAGRERQAATWQALEDRRAMLDRRATALFQAQQERQFQAEQRDRILRAHELKFFRLDHLEERQQQRNHHHASREFLIQERVRKAAELSLRQEMQHQQTRQRESPTLSR